MRGIMNLTLQVTLCVIGLALVLGDDNRQKRPQRGMQNIGGSSKCKYYRKGDVSQCDETTQMKSVTFLLKKGVNCPPTQVYHKPCSEDDEANSDNSVNGCKYDRRVEWTECGPTDLSKVKVMPLKPGQPASCLPNQTKTVPCKNRRNKPGKLGKRKGKVCKYLKGAWSECDANTNTRTRELTLKKGNESVCLRRKTITKRCKKPCKYNKGAWSPCNEATKEKTRQLTLRKGDPNTCNATMTIVKPCRRRDAFTAAKISKCKYKPLGWGECDPRTNTMTRVLKLKSGDPALCQLTKQLTRKCRKPCRFSKGEWSECDESTNLKMRTDHLIKGDSSQCESTRVITRKCGRDEDCIYEITDWGKCDETTKERTRLKKLLSGDPEKCEAEVTISRPCFKPNGEESCFLGNWGEYGPCQNGVMMKHRPVIAGGVRCERKAVKTKPCS